LSIFRVSSPPAQTQSPPIENFLATVLVASQIFVASYAYAASCSQETAHTVIYFVCKC